MGMIVRSKFTGIHITDLLSDPYLVEIVGGDGPPEFGIVISVDGKQNVLVMPVRVAERLGHAIEHGHLPKTQCQITDIRW